MSSAKLTMISFYQHLKSINDDLFKNLNIPESIDKEVLINNILLEGAEFEVLYSNPYLMQDAIGVWSTKYARTFEKWVNALNIDYNPLENYDRIEDYTDDSSGNTTNNSIDESKKSAYDSVNYQPYGQSTNDSRSDSEGHNTHHGRLHGNIGVTTSQQMLKSELDIAEWNLYQHITDLFLDEFVIQVYI